LPAKGSICEGPQSNKLALMGLKPWAESYSPFGARVAGTTLNISYSIPSDRAFLAANAHWHWH
jgi:hypothetical protein